jgi:hypothetical protein
MGQFSRPLTTLTVHQRDRGPSCAELRAIPKEGCRSKRTRVAATRLFLRPGRLEATAQRHGLAPRAAQEALGASARLSAGRWVTVSAARFASSCGRVTAPDSTTDAHGMASAAARAIASSVTPQAAASAVTGPGGPPAGASRPLATASLTRTAPASRGGLCRNRTDGWLEEVPRHLRRGDQLLPVDGQVQRPADRIRLLRPARRQPDDYALGAGGRAR